MAGHIDGKDAASERPDLDYFQVPAGSGRRALSARVEGIPGADLVLELFDANGSLLAKSDSRGVGAGEWIQPTVIGPAEVYLLVRQLWVQGQPVLEHLPDGYRLIARWGPVEPGWESEPDDRAEQATSAAIGAPMRGYLGTADDRDWFAYRATRAGTLRARVVAPEGVATEIESEARPEKELPARPSARGKPAAPVSAARAEGELRLPVTAGQVVRLAVVRRPKEILDLKAPENTVGLDSAYELDVQLTAP